MFKPKKLALIEHKATIEGQSITFNKKSDLGLDPFIKKSFRMAGYMAAELGVKVPYLRIKPEYLMRENELDGSLTQEVAHTYFPNNENNLKNALVILSSVVDDWVFNGSFAHEMRHLWQKKYHPEKCEFWANGFQEALIDPLEIDADAYAIYYLAKHMGLPVEEVAEHICPNEKKCYRPAYDFRVEKAKNFDLKKI